MPFAVTWMDLEIIKVNEVRERQTSYGSTYMWNVRKWSKSTYLQNRNSLTDTGNKLLVTKWESEERDKPGIWDSSGSSGKEPCLPMQGHKRCRFDPWIRKIPWRRAQQLTPVFLPGESMDIPWTEEPGRLHSMMSQSDMTEWLSTSTTCKIDNQLVPTV